MYDPSDALATAALAAAEGVASPEELQVLEADPQAWQDALDRLIEEVLANRESVAARLRGPERSQVLADFDQTLFLLEAAFARLSGAEEPEGAAEGEEVRLQASWSHGRVVIWAGARGAEPADNDALADLLEEAGGPPHGWAAHPDVVLPGQLTASALAIPVSSILGWLVAVGNGLAEDSVGPSVTWLGRLAVAGVRLVAEGRFVPDLDRGRRQGASQMVEVRWVPALLDGAELGRMAAAMPPAVGLLVPSDPRAIALSVLGAVVDAIVRDAASRIELPAPPPVTLNPAQVCEAVVTRLNGSSFRAPVAVAADLSGRLDRWAGQVTDPSRPRLIVTLDPPDKGNAWFLSVLATAMEGKALPVEQAMAATKRPAPMAEELERLERMFPALLRPGGLRRGQVYLDQSEAWELMSETGATLEAAGFEVRVPALSRRKPSPRLHLFSMPAGDSVVGARQLSDVRWSVVFDDVELTAAEIARLAAEAKPLVHSRGRWVELDHADLKEAAAALAERAHTTRLTGAEILRHAVGLEASPLAGGLSVEGGGWASDLLAKAQQVSTRPVEEPEGFSGQLRSYQAEALAWLGFLDTVGLGGCLALDMGLGKTPTVLAHLARNAGQGPALVVAPPAVVGNWAAEAARFTPGLRVVVHHGNSRSAGEELKAEVSRADVVITTYGTAVRDVEALGQVEWDGLVLDEAQAIKNPASETAAQLRNVPARVRLALTGTPVENGLGDLWSILDFTNPGLVGPRAGFIAKLSGEGEAALRALNGILVFRRTKSEPEVAKELPDRIDQLDHCTMTPEQIGLYQAVLDQLLNGTEKPQQGAILAAITALKQICNHPAAYEDDGRPLAGRSGKLARLEEIIESVFAAGEKILVFTHFAEWGRKMAIHLSEVTGTRVACYHGDLGRTERDRLVAEFQGPQGPGALVLSLKAGGTGLNLTAASHVVLYDRWWNPAVEDQARDRAWRIGQTRTVVSHRLVCPGTVDERVEEVVAGKRHVADLVLPKSSSLSDLDAAQLRVALGLRPDSLLADQDR
jgi:superfamily II DNA or RNA helicase